MCFHRAYLISLVYRIIPDALFERLHEPIDDRSTKVYASQNGNRSIDAILQFGEVQRIQSNRKRSNSGPCGFHDYVHELHRIGGGILADGVSITLQISNQKINVNTRFHLLCTFIQQTCAVYLHDN